MWILNATLVLLLLPFHLAEIFSGKCPRRNSSLRIDVESLPHAFYAIFTIPREISSDPFDFYLTEYDFIQHRKYENAIVFYRVCEYLSWNYQRKPCPLSIGLRLEDDGACGKTLLFEKLNEEPLCEGAMWSNNVFESRTLPGLVMLLGCRMVNDSHFDSASWVLLSFNMFSSINITQSKGLYKTLLVDLLHSANITEIDPDRFRILIDTELLNNADDPASHSCCNNSCKYDSKQKQRLPIAKTNILTLCYVLFGLIVVVIVLLTIKYL